MTPFTPTTPARPRRRRARIVAAAAAALTALAAGGVALWPASSTPATRVAGRASSPHRAGPSWLPPRSPSPSPAAVPPGAPQIPQVDLTGLRWADFHGMQLPVSLAAGPRQVRGGLPSGFADTPLGALLAAVNIGVRANAQWGPDVFGPTIGDQVTGPDAPALLAACQAAYDQARPAAGVPAGRPLGPAYVREEAFRWEGYTPANATVDIVSAGPGGPDLTVRAATRIEVQWRRGDWRVVAPPGGDWGNSATQITSLSGYTRLPSPLA
jgi:hypothetical protein